MKRTVFLLKPAQDNIKKEDAAEKFFVQLAEILKGEPLTLSAEIVAYNKFLWFFLTCPEYVQDVVKGQWRSFYPETEIEEVKDYTDVILQNQTYHVLGSELYYEQPEFSLRRQAKAEIKL